MKGWAKCRAKNIRNKKSVGAFCCARIPDSAVSRNQPGVYAGVLLVRSEAINESDWSSFNRRAKKKGPQAGRQSGVPSRSACWPQAPIGVQSIRGILLFVCDRFAGNSWDYVSTGTLGIFVICLLFVCSAYGSERMKKAAKSVGRMPLASCTGVHDSYCRRWDWKILRNSSDGADRRHSALGEPLARAYPFRKT